MNYEEKYKETLKIIESLYNVIRYQSSSDALFVSQTIEKAFPELCESEDERIKKELISFFTKRDEFTKSEPFNGLSSKQIISWLEKQGEQKPVEQDTEIHDLWVYIREWNEKFGRLPKDEDELEACIDYVMKRQKPAGWSKEDEKLYTSALWHIKNSCGNGGNDSGKYEVYNWLKSIKDRVQPNPKQEWSEEDEKISNAIYESIDFICLKSFGFSEDEVCDWLKSPKPNHWKPSEEQMEALFEAKLASINNREYFLGLLYEDLKKLQLS